VQFHPLPPPWDDDVARLLGQIARAIHRLVERHLAQRGDDEPLDLLAAEQAQAITALPWPDRPPPPKPTSRRSAFLDGYSLHADRFIRARGRASAHGASRARSSRGARAVVARVSDERGAPAEPPARVASRNKWARIEALLRNRAFVIEYASARDRWRNGIPAAFSPGTYWLQRFVSVPVLET
jgi:hypothetical protein